MKMIVTVVLHIWCTNSSIAHDSTGASRFHGCCIISVTVVVLRVIGTKLMPHFMCYVVNIKWVANRSGASGNTTRFVSS